MKFDLKIGSRAQVMHGKAEKTSGGLKKKDLKYKNKRIISIKASKAAKKSDNLRKSGYFTIKGKFGSFKKNKKKIKKGGAEFIPPNYENIQNFSKRIRKHITNVNDIDVKNLNTYQIKNKEYNKIKKNISNKKFDSRINNQYKKYCNTLTKYINNKKNKALTNLTNLTHIIPKAPNKKNKKNFRKLLNNSNFDILDLKEFNMLNFDEQTKYLQDLHNKLRKKLFYNTNKINLYKNSDYYKTLIKLHHKN